MAMLTLPRTRLRILCMIPVVIGLLTWQVPPRPDLIISENGRSIAIAKPHTEHLHLIRSSPASFAAKLWEKAWGLDPAQGNGITGKCGKDLCEINTGGSVKIMIVYSPDLIESACKNANLLIAPRLWWVNCPERRPETILQRHDFEQYGTHAFHFGADGSVKIRKALPQTGRPWNRTVTQPRTISDIDGSIRRDAPEP